MHYNNQVKSNDIRVAFGILGDWVDVGCLFLANWATSAISMVMVYGGVVVGFGDFFGAIIA